MIHQLLVAFIFLKLAKDFFETYLSMRNRAYYRDKSKQENAKKILGISDEEFDKILSYTEDKYMFAKATGWFHTLVVFAFLILGGFTFVERIAKSMASELGTSEIWTGLAFFAVLGFVNALYAIPFDLYQTFKIEEKHGFNRQTVKGFFADKVKGTVLSVILGGAFLALILWTMDSGAYWWVYAWAATALFGMLVSWLYPTLLAPLFNKFSPLPEGDLKEQIYELAKKVEFRTSGIYIMDASKRSSHGNAYFTGIFGEKRIVLFDTLLESLSPQEIVAVLAHELGHFKLHHVRTGLLRSILIMGLLFFVMSLCKPLEVFYQAFGFAGVSNYGAIVVFSLWYGIVGFVFTPLQAWLSQRNEFAADAFAKKNIDTYETLSNALVKLGKRNQSMPLTDPKFSFFYYSHPPLLERLSALKKSRSL